MQGRWLYKIEIRFINIIKVFVSGHTKIIEAFKARFHCRWFNNGNHI